MPLALKLVSCDTTGFGISIIWCRWHHQQYHCIPWVETIKMRCNNTRNPLTAVLIVSITVLPNLPCLYREFLCVWCHFMISYRERAAYKIAQPPFGQFCLPCWVRCQLFILNDLIGPNEVTWPNSFAMQFSTSLSSSGGIIFKKKRVFLYKIIFNYFWIWMSYFS